MTVKLYENNVMLKFCEAKVISCVAVKDLFYVELDQTVFFPEGGGQLSDRGTINGVKVLHVNEKDGHIYHECEQPVEVGATVKAQLDWQVRLDRMQQHCGEHILSYAVYKLFGANNVGFRMNEDQVFIDLDKELTDEQLLEAELYTNQVIWENRPIHVEYMDSTEAVKLKDKMRKFNDKLTGILRIVSVEDCDVCTCCGTHPPFTGMLGSVKVIRHEKHKSGTRVEFVVGMRALKDADQKNAALLSVAHSLSSKPLEVPERVEKLKAELDQVKAEAKAKMTAILVKEMEAELEAAPYKADGTRILCYGFEGDGKDVKALISTAQSFAKTLTIICANDGKRLTYAILQGTGAGLDARTGIKAVNDAFGGRGGGKPDCAQGGADSCLDWADKLENVTKQLVEL